MADVIVLPKMGLTMESGEVLRWLIAVGEPVLQGQEVVEVETYKAVLTVESPIAGVLRAVIEPGTTVPAGAVIGIVADVDESLDGVVLWTPDAGADAASQTDQPKATSASPIPAAGTRGGVTSGGASDGLRASPLARRMADELGVDLTTVVGTGPHGRITQSDVEAAVGVSGSTGLTAPSPNAIANGRRVALTPMRRAIAELMSASALVPQFTLEATADLRELTLFARERPTFSYTSVIVAACARALREMPIANASFDGDAIIEHADVNIGIALALEHGLLVPVVHHADRLNLSELGDERRRLTRAATAGTLAASDLLGATFTVSNLGSYGIERFRALVVPPQAAILAVGAARQERLALSLSCDHRVLDGAPAARFLGHIVEHLQTPGWLETLP